MKQPFPDPKVSVEDIRSNSTKIIKLPIYKHTQKDLIIFYKDGGDGWRIGREACYKNGSYLFKSNEHAIEPWLTSKKWDAAGDPRTIIVTCATLEENKFRCVNDPCGNNGKCYGGISSFYCDCSSSWTGKMCTIPAKCNSEVYEWIYIRGVVPLTISVACILTIGFILCRSCQCCCNFENPVDPTENCIGKNCSPPILEKSYFKLSQKNKTPPEVVHLSEKDPFI